MIQGKLVRDGIPDIIRANGEEPILSFLENSEVMPALGAKLVEEGWEVYESQTKKDIGAELVDYREVLDSIYKLQGYNFSSISQTIANLKDEQEELQIPQNLKLSILQQNAINSALGVQDALINDEGIIKNLSKAYRVQQQLAEFIGMSPNVLAQKQLIKRQKVGGFVLGVVLEDVKQT